MSEPARWRARPALSACLRLGLLAVPFAASWVAISLVGRALPPGGARTWWGLLALLGAGLVVALAVERGARWLLPVTLLLRLSMVFPDRAPSRFRLARAAVSRQPRSPGGTSSRTDLVRHLVQRLGALDRCTRGHSERVRVLSDMLATEVGLDAAARDRLRCSALLHDVGKVEVPARELNKPGRVAQAELDRVRLHPAAGEELARPLLGWLGAEGLGIVDHHEKYDGTGYPAGKARDEICAAGRLVRLVDAFETMTSMRPYKKAMATRAAREELARCAGTHFDPAYVKAFVALSVPRVLWAMGPLSFVLQLPSLRSLAQAGALAPRAVASLVPPAAAKGPVLEDLSAPAPAEEGPGAPLELAAPPGTAVAPGAAPAGVAPEPLSPASASTAPVAPAPGVGPNQAPGVATAAPRGAPAPQPPRPTPSPERPATAPAPAADAAQPEPGPPPTPAAPGPVAPPLPPLPVPGPVAPSPSPSPSPSPDVAPPSSPAGPATPAGPASPPAPPPSGPPTPTPAHPGAPPAEGLPPAAPAPTASSSPSPTPPPRPAPGHTAVTSGPPSTTSSQDATFMLVDGGPWECQLQASADGASNAWHPCSGTFTRALLRDGDQLLRVRDAATHEVVDSWAWTVASQELGG